MLKKLYLCSVSDYVDPHSLWLAIKEDGLSFNSKASQKLKLHTYSSVKFHRDHEDPQKVSRLYVEPCNDSKSTSCWRFTLDQTRLKRKGISARFCPARTFVDSIPALKKISKKEMPHERRLKLEFCNDHNMYFAPIIPYFENSVTIDQEIPNVPALYSLISKRGNSKGDIVNIGISNNLKVRIKQKLRHDWNFYFIDYSILDSEKDRKYWETYYLDDYKKVHGSLPLYNLQGGQKFNEDELEEISNEDSKQIEIFNKEVA